MSDPPLVEMISEDPVLRNTKLISEAWDCDGLFQVTSYLGMATYCSIRPSVEKGSVKLQCKTSAGISRIRHGDAVETRLD